MPAAPPLGLDAKLYVNTGTFGSPTWTEIDITKDVTLGQSAGAADVTSRGSGGYIEELATLKALNLSFNINKVIADAQFETLRDAFKDRTTVDMAVADGGIATSGTEYTRFEGKVFDWNENQQLTEGLTVDVVIRPTPNANAAPTFNQTG